MAPKKRKTSAKKKSAKRKPTKTTKKKKRQHAKIPAKGQKPRSAYIIYCMILRAELVQRAEGSTTFAEMAKAMSESWHALEDTQKSPYEALAACDRQRVTLASLTKAPKEQRIAAAKTALAALSHAAAIATGPLAASILADTRASLQDLNLGSQLVELAAELGLSGRLSELLPCVDEDFRNKVVGAFMRASARAEGRAALVKCRELEQELFALLGREVKEYRRRARSLAFNLGEGGALLRRVLEGSLAAREVVRLEAEELASNRWEEGQLKRRRQEADDVALESRSSEDEGSESSSSTSSSGPGSEAEGSE